ncbi:MHYT domain-containing protein [Streptosporangium carneum]|uniref:Membrane protein n=1 Tax=Streptosporangium carneum TaxID=47481 RepID=A0A9W6I1N4_9ACTN|nr:MHYT domain-containing protein [Streptosporangium carneum]GLK10068.1 membrane protein [Streptosporangium carneum]
MLGLSLTAKARATTGSARVRWLVGGALSIGGTGIWVMHFVAMTGFTVGGNPIRYDVPLTIASMVLAVAIVGAGLFMVSARGEKIGWLLLGGVITGLGVAGMHYLGLFAMNLSANIYYDVTLVALSVVIAIAAATVALWFSLRTGGALTAAGGALIMAIAVSGMHYVGMFAMEVHPRISLTPVDGARGVDFMLPVLAVVSLLTLGLLLAVILAPSEQEMRTDAELLAHLENRRSGQPDAPTTPGRPVVSASPPAEAQRRPSLFDANEG